MDDSQRSRTTKDQVVTYRVTREEKRLLERIGKRLNINVSELLRQRTAKDLARDLARERKLLRKPQT